MLPFLLRKVLKRIYYYTPTNIQRWVDDQRLIHKIKNRELLVNVEEIKRKFREVLVFLAKKIGSESLGDYLEFGVYNGTSIACMHHITEELGFSHIRLFGFDSFEGLPKAAKTDDGGHWRPGQFKSDIEFTRQVLTHERVNWSRIILTKGFFDHTLSSELIKKHNIMKASVIFVDCDIYSSTKLSLEFCSPLIVDMAVIIFDDWYPLSEKNLGEKRAFDEFLKNYPMFIAEEFGIYPPYGQSFLVSRKMHATD